MREKITKNREGCRNPLTQVMVEGPALENGYVVVVLVNIG